MVYNPNVPANANEDPSLTQPNLTANFQALNTFLSVNHVSLNDPNQGFHSFLQMPEQGSPPITGADIAALYMQEVPTLGKTGLYFRNESNGTSLQLTNAYITDLSNGGTAGGTLYRMNIPLGFTIYAGITSTIPATTAQTVVLPVAFTKLITANATINNGNFGPNGTIQTGLGILPTLTGMTIYVNKAFVISWIMIGII